MSALNFVALRDSLVQEVAEATVDVINAQVMLDKFDDFLRVADAGPLRCIIDISTAKKVPTSALPTSSTTPKRRAPITSKARTKTRLVDYIIAVLKEQGPMSVRDLPAAIIAKGRPINSVHPVRLIGVTIHEHRRTFVRCGNGVWRLRRVRQQAKKRP